MRLDLDHAAAVGFEEPREDLLGPVDRRESDEERERIAKEEASTLAQAKLDAARAKVAELQAQQAALQTRRSQVSDDERDRINLRQDQQRKLEVRERSPAA